MFQTFLIVRQKGKEPNHAPACSSARFQHPVPPDLESLSDALWTLVPGKKFQPGLNKTVYCYKSIQFANLATTKKMQTEYMKSQGRNFLWPMSYNQRNDISAKTDHKRSQNNILCTLVPDICFWKVPTWANHVAKLENWWNDYVLKALKMQPWF